MATIGALRERLVVQRNDPPTLTLSSLTRSATTATATTAEPHGYLATDYVTIAGCDGSTTAYNAKWKIVAVPTALTFTFTCSSAIPTPATGTPTTTYASNAQGGAGANGSNWRTLQTTYGEYVPLKSWESLQLRAVQSDTTGRFRVRASASWSQELRILWTPSWPSGSARKTLEITGVNRDPDDVAFQLIDVAEVSA